VALPVAGATPRRSAEKMKNSLLIFMVLMALATSWVFGDPREHAEELLIHAGEQLRFEKIKDEHASHGYLSDISFTETTSSPRSFVAEGHIKHSNNGGPLERVPIYIGKDRENVPVLVAMTNCDGHFKFRLWIKGDARSSQVQTTAEFDGYLYVMGSFEKASFPSGSYTQRYSLKDLQSLYTKKAEQAAPSDRDKPSN
jgi:hypothetical protein